MQLKGDLSGGVISALIPFPKAMALGVLVFAPLGPDFISFGIIAGLIALIISNVTVAFLGAMPIMISAPYSLSSFMLLAALNIIIGKLGGNISNTAMASVSVAFLFLTIFLSGGFQCLFGLCRIGDLAKYIPYPVLAGLVNGSALMIIFFQIKVILGLPKTVALKEIVSHFSEIQFFTLVVGLTACLAIWGGPRIIKKIPSPFYGLIAGSMVYYLFVFIGLENSLGSVIGAIPSIIPTPRYGMEFFQLIIAKNYWPLIVELIPLALGVAAINSLRSLVVCTTADNLIEKRSNANKELFGQGCGNMMNGIFGGISTASSMPSTLANYQYGGRTSFSRAVSGIFPLLVLLFLYPLVAKIPHAVLAGLLIMIALESIDAWSLNLFSQVKPAWTAGDKSSLVNLIIVLTVTAIVIIFGILEALGFGLAISIGWFVVRMSKSVIRQEFKADTFHSNTQRRKEEFELLEKEGHLIRILELEGALFFGTSDKIAVHVENYLKNSVAFKGLIVEICR
ncbi:SulP family inorganic anion transporter [Thermodesulfobacteriota bacterium]